MRALKIIAYIVAAILIFFGVLYIWSGLKGTLLPGIISVVIGLGLIFWAARRPAQPQQTNVTLNVDLPGNVNMDTLKCQSCGGTLAPEDVKMVAGAPVVTCPWCHTTYQLTEEPKW